MSGPLPFSEERFTPVPAVRRIKESMVQNDSNRLAVNWGTADYKSLSEPQRDAIHEVVSSLLFAEAHGNDVCGNLIRRIPFADITDAFAVQILDESHHARLLTRYLVQEMGRPPRDPPFITWLTVAQLRRIGDPLLCAMAAGHFVECAAAEVQWEMIHKIDEPLMAEVFRVILRDEARHQALGREATLFLLEQPDYRRGWKLARAKMYRHFLGFYSQVTLHRYGRSARLFGIDVAQVHKRTMDKVAAAVPL